MKRNVCGLLLAGLGLLMLTGCGSATTAESIIGDSNKTNMDRVINLYERFQISNRWRGPKDEAEFKEFVSGLDEKTLGRMGIEPGTTDGVFINERDNEPFVIRFSVKGSARGSNEAIVFENTGVDGVRLVGMTSRMTEEVTDDSRYRGLLDGSQMPESSIKQTVPGI